MHDTGINTKMNYPVDLRGLIMQTVVRVALGVFIGMWAVLISLLIVAKLFGAPAILDLLF